MAIFEIQPSSNFPITRLLPDIGDGVTYYVQAVIRYASSGKTIATVDLANQGNRLWGSIWRTIADSVGQGVFVTITSIAYVDSAYTQPSPNYYPESNTYCIYDRYNYVQQLSTQVGAQISIPETDYKKIARIMLATLKGIDFPDYPYTDWTPHFDRVTDAIKTNLEGLKFTEPKEYQPTDLTPLHEAIRASEGRIHKRFDALPEPTDLDLSPVLEALKSPDHTETIQKTKELHALMTELKGRMDQTMPEFGKYLDGITGNLKDFLYMVGQKEARTPKEKEQDAGPKIRRDGLVRSTKK